jgi:hypothetical protein
MFDDVIGDLLTSAARSAHTHTLTQPGKMYSIAPAQHEHGAGPGRLVWSMPLLLLTQFSNQCKRIK